MKVLCYGVRDVEIPFFNEINKKFDYDLKLTEQYLNVAETAYLAKGFDCVILRGNCWANKENLDIFKECGVKYVLTRTVGKNHIDVDYAKSLGFKMAFVPFYSPNAIAELAVTHAMMLLRHTAYTCNKTSKKDFTVDSEMFAKEIRNCTVGVVGLGNIGFTSAKLFHGLGAKVIGFDVFEKGGIEDVVTQVSMEELITTSDIITLHCPYIPENGKVVTREFLSKMKPGAILVNTARGELQDIDAIIENIKSGHLGGVGLDVLEGEGDYFFKNFEGKELPNETIKELVELYPKVLITPHIGSYTDEALCNMIETSYENLKEFIFTGQSKNSI